MGRKVRTIRRDQDAPYRIPPRKLGEQLDIRHTPDPFPKKKFGQKSEGRLYGLGIMEFWAALFRLNGMLSKSRKMTDEEIKRQVILEYPDRKAVKRLGALGEKGDVTVNYYRTLYNRGRLTGGVPPDKKSVRYGADGRIVKARSGVHVLTTELFHV